MRKIPKDSGWDSAPAQLTAYQQCISDLYSFKVQYPERSSCLRALAGLKCRGIPKCICRYQFLSYGPDFLDHSHRWQTHTGNPVITSEPYTPAITNHPEEFLAFQEELKALNMCLTFGRISPWSPSHGGDLPTQLLLFSPHGYFTGPLWSSKMPTEYIPLLPVTS